MLRFESYPALDVEYVGAGLVVRGTTHEDRRNCEVESPVVG